MDGKIPRVRRPRRRGDRDRRAASARSSHAAEPDSRGEVAEPSIIGEQIVQGGRGGGEEGSREEGNREEGAGEEEPERRKEPEKEEPEKKEEPKAPVAKSDADLFYAQAHGRIFLNGRVDDKRAHAGRKDAIPGRGGSDEADRDVHKQRRRRRCQRVGHIRRHAARQVVVLEHVADSASFRNC